MTLHDHLVDAIVDDIHVEPSLAHHSWNDKAEIVRATLAWARAHRVEVIEHLGLRDLMIRTDSICSHVAFRKMLSKTDIDELTDISRRARECYQDKPE